MGWWTRMQGRGLVAGYLVFSGSSGRLWASRDVYGDGFGVGAVSPEAMAVHCYALRCTAAQLGTPLQGARGVGGVGGAGVHLAFAEEGGVAVAVVTDARADGGSGGGRVGQDLAKALASAVAAKYAGVIGGAEGGARQVRLKKLDAVAEECVRKVGPAVLNAVARSLQKTLMIMCDRAEGQQPPCGFYATLASSRPSGERQSGRDPPSSLCGCLDGCFGGNTVAPGPTQPWAQVHEWFDLGGSSTCCWSRKGQAGQGGVQVTCAWASAQRAPAGGREAVGPAPDFSADACCLAARGEAGTVPLPEPEPGREGRAPGAATQAREVLVLRTATGAAMAVPLKSGGLDGAPSGLLLPHEVPAAQTWADDPSQGHALLSAWLVTLDARVKQADRQ